MADTDIKPILDAAQVSDDVKAHAWEAFHAAKNDAEFRLAFGSIPLPDEIKAHLWEAKGFQPEHQVSPETQAILAAQKAKYPSAQELGHAVPTYSTSDVLSDFTPTVLGPAVKDLAHRGANFLEEQGPEMVGAGIGGALGTLVEPGGGTVVGGAGGAAAVRAARLAYRAKYGDAPAPATIGEAAKDIGGQALGGALQEAGPEAVKLGQAAIDAAAARAGVSASAIGSPALAAAKTVGPYIKSRLTPEQQDAVDLAKTNPKLAGSMSADVTTGSRLAAGMKAGIRNLPGAAGVIDANEATAREGYQELGDDIGARIGQTPGKLGLGSDIQSTVAGEGARIDAVQQAARDAAIKDARDSMGSPLKGTIETMEGSDAAKQAAANAEKAAANAKYTEWRNVVNDPANAEEVQTGTKTVPGRAGMVGGSPAKTVPILETLNTPIDMRPIQAALKPIFARLTNSSTVEQQAASPGYGALKALMGRKPYISADDANNLVSGLGQLASDAFDFPGMNNQGQGITVKMRSMVKDALDSKLASIAADGEDVANGTAKDILDAGRKLIGEKAETYGTKTAKTAANAAANRPIEDLITEGNIKGVASLIDQTNGTQLPVWRRRVVDSMISDSTVNGKLDAAKLASKWNSPQLTPELKKMFFTPDQIAKMDKAASPDLIYGPSHPVTLAYNRVKGLLSGSPATAVDALQKNGDVGLPELKQVLRLNPSLAEPLGKTVYQGILDGATNAKDEFLPDQAFRKWRGLGMQTQLALTKGDPKLVADITNFFRLGSMLKATANPSGTAPVAALLKYASDAATSIGGLAGAGFGAIAGGLQGAELGTLAGAGAGAIAKIGGIPLAANQLAKLLYAPGGAALLTKAMTLPAVSPAAEALMERILGKAVAVGAIDHMPTIQSDRNPLNANPGAASRMKNVP